MRTSCGDRKMGKNGKYSGKGNSRCGYTDLCIECHRDNEPKVHKIIDRYPGISYGTSNKVIGTLHLWIPVRVDNGDGSKNLPLLKRDLKESMGIFI